MRGRLITFSGMDGSGKCALEDTHDHSDAVYGVLFEIDDAQWPRLDAAEGVEGGGEVWGIT